MRIVISYLIISIISNLSAPWHRHICGQHHRRSARLEAMQGLIPISLLLGWEDGNTTGATPRSWGYPKIDG